MQNRLMSSAPLLHSQPDSEIPRPDWLTPTRTRTKRSNDLVTGDPGGAVCLAAMWARSVVSLEACQRDFGQLRSRSLQEKDLGAKTCAASVRAGEAHALLCDPTRRLIWLGMHYDPKAHRKGTMDVGPNNARLAQHAPAFPCCRKISQQSLTIPHPKLSLNNPDLHTLANQYGKNRHTLNSSWWVEWQGWVDLKTVI